MTFSLCRWVKKETINAVRLFVPSLTFESITVHIAFYAPMKSPSHPVPSGDRTMAQLLLAALRTIGHDVTVVSCFRSWDHGHPPGRTQRLATVGKRLAQRLIRRFQRTHPPHVWFTYHVYHKAADWLGPTVCDAFRLPYVIAEASFAPKQAHGTWKIGHQQVASAVRRADAVLNITSRDATCLRPLLATSDRMVLLPPFIAPRHESQTTQARHRAYHRHRFARMLDLSSEVPWLLAVGMMRGGDKSRSYQILARALAGLVTRRWRLLIVGDGCARSHVVESFRSVPSDRVRWLGTLDADTLKHVYCAVDLMVWPAINEAYGMALLEAQAAGCAVVAGRSGGVAEIIDDQVTGLLTPAGNETEFAANIAHLLDDPERRVRLGQNGARKVAAKHSFEKACDILDHTLNTVVKRRVHSHV